MGKEATPPTRIVVNTPNRGPRAAVSQPWSDEMRSRVRVKLRPPRNATDRGHLSTVCAGQRIAIENARDDGWIVLEPVTDRQLEQLRAIVAGEEERDLVAKAERVFQRDFEAFARDKAGEKAFAKTEQGRLILEQLAAEVPDSVEAHFQDAEGRGFKPLVALEVIETGLPPAESEEQRRMRMLIEAHARQGGGTSAEELAIAVTTALKAAGIGGSGDAAKVAALEAQVAEMRAMLESLTAPAKSDATAKDDTKKTPKQQ